jgi:hypothetical protein
LVETASEDPLYKVVTGKAYYAIGLDDVPREYILGGRCFRCARVGPLDRLRIERRFGHTRLRDLDDRLRCVDCHNRFSNRFTIYGKMIWL